MRLLLATNNAGKVREVTRILDVPGLEIATPASIGREFEVAEDGLTFADNARIKARAAWRQFGLPALADDSGLEIDALRGRPGVQSARFLGVETPFADKCRAILELMAGVRECERSARFRCCAALARGGNDVTVFDGVCEGRIADEPRGSGGFGYDPIFLPDGLSRTFAELEPDVKNGMSHRGKAFRAVRDYLLRSGRFAE